MLLVVTSKYVSKHNPYANSFIHTRVKLYQRYGIDTSVFVLNSKLDAEEYIIEGVKVQVGSKTALRETINEYSPALCIHFLNPSIIEVLESIYAKLNIIVFVHGVEALHWYQRIFPGIMSSIRQAMAFFKYIVHNAYSIHRIRRFLSNNTHELCFVAVSEWMKNIAENTWKCKDRFEWHIIPNAVDNKLFRYVEKKSGDRFSLLSIRPFDTGKYANDLTAKLIVELSKEKEFSSLHFTWVGKGRLYNKTVSSVNSYPNVELINRMLSQNEIPTYHAKNGFFICPTRQDAQGVSMCEAMSSGLVPITLYNTAIPEYLPEDSRLACHTVDEMRLLVLRLIRNPNEYKYLSRLCSDFIQDKCGLKNTVERELYLIRRHANLT